MVATQPNRTTGTDSGHHQSGGRDIHLDITFDVAIEDAGASIQTDITGACRNGFQRDGSTVRVQADIPAIGANSPRGSGIVL